MEYLAKLHPLLVHFPIAIFSLYIFFELLTTFWENENLSVFINILLLLGVLGGLASVLTGNQAHEALKPFIEKHLISNELIEEHEQFANITLWYFFAILVARFYFTTKKLFTKKIKIVFLIFALIGSYFIYETGEHGGKLVYKYGAGTELMNQKIEKVK